MEAFAMAEPEPKVSPQELSLYEQRAVSAIDEARLIATSVVDDPSCQRAADWIKTRKIQLVEVEDKSGIAMFREYLHRGHKAACDRIKAYTDPIKTGIQMVRGSIAEYDARMERQRQEDQRKLDEAARKRDEEIRLAEAEKLAKIGNTAAADKVLETPGAFTAPQIERPKIAGVSMRTIWEAKVTDKREFLKFIGELPGYEHFVSIDLREIANFGKKTDGNIALPGIEIIKRKMPSIS